MKEVCLARSIEIHNSAMYIGTKVDQIFLEVNIIIDNVLFLNIQDEIARGLKF